MIDRLLVINDLSWSKGGASALAVQSAIDLKAQGLSVEFLSGDDGVGSPLLDHDIPVHALGSGRLLDRPGPLAALDGLYNRHAARLLAGWIKRNDTPGTVYHLHGWSQVLSPSIFGPLRQVADRLVISAHDFFLACPNGAIYDYTRARNCDLTPSSFACLVARCDRRSHAHKLWRSLRQVISLNLMSFAQMPNLLLIHKGMAPYFERAGVPKAKLRVMPNPVVPYAPCRIRAEENREVLFVGRLEETKGVDLALAACRAAGAHITVVGDGALLDPLRARYHEMTFTGRLSATEIAAHAERARFLVMPSRYMEPFGLSAVEALWSGLPVILSDCSLLAEDIVAAGAGFALEPRDTAGFAAAVRKLMERDELCAAMSQAAFCRTRNLAMTRPDWIAALAHTYRALICDAAAPNACPAAASPSRTR